MLGESPEGIIAALCRQVSAFRKACMAGREIAEREAWPVTKMTIEQTDLEAMYKHKE